MNEKDIEMLKAAYNEISVISVAGDAVDIIASAKAKIRTVITNAEKTKPKSNTENNK